MPRIPLYQVDAFSDRPFAGNPAAVCLLDAPCPNAWLQAVAAEMNLSETAFVWPGEGAWALRWFTPKTEVDLCGHATLAAAHVLWESGRLAADEPARFDSRSGRLVATRRDGWIELDFPATPATAVEAPAELIEALGVAPVWTGRSRFDYLVEVTDEDVVRALHPNFALLATLPSRGVIVTSRARTADCDFVSRFFAPAAGIDEDPVTGSAHCALGPYWQARLGRDVLTAYQASSRGGVLRVRVGPERVYIAGQAVTLLRGEIDA